MAFLYPWGNTQQLNLDWILQKIKELESRGGGGGADIEEIANVLIALTYRSANSYQRYDYAFYNGKLYRATANTTGAFNPADWLEVQIGNDVAILTRLVNAVDASLTTLQGQVADLDSDDVDNASNVTGDTVSDALDNLNGALAGNVVPATDDLDNYKTSDYNGFYSIGGQKPSNCPISWTKLIVIADSYSTSQFIFGEAGLYFRQLSGSPLAWSPWRVFNYRLNNCVIYEDVTQNNVAFPASGYLNGSTWRPNTPTGYYFIGAEVYNAAFTAGYNFPIIQGNGDYIYGSANQTYNSITIRYIYVLNPTPT